MIHKAYEIWCDYCGLCVPDFYDSKQQAERWYKEQGGIVKGKRHFCDKECYNNFMGKKNSAARLIKKENSKFQ